MAFERLGFIHYNCLTYLGVVPSNRTDWQRLKAARGAFYTLQGAGLCVSGVQSEAMTSIYKQAVEAVFMYGMNCCCFLSKQEGIERLDTVQRDFLKVAIGISNSCRTTSLMGRLETHNQHIRIQEMGLLKSAIRSTSRTRSSYTYLIVCLLANVLKTRHYYTVCYRRVKNRSFLLYNACVVAADSVSSVTEN